MMLRNASQISLVAALSLGTCPRDLMKGIELGLRCLGAADFAAIAAFFIFVLLIGRHAPDGPAMPRTQNS
ncbi:MAG: hypothetical protein H7255_15770 [Ramlibacter sp.]|nr:hypothetical protein [Ramlibacter sp.]